MFQQSFRDLAVMAFLERGATIPAALEGADQAARAACDRWGHVTIGAMARVMGMSPPRDFQGLHVCTRCGAELEDEDEDGRPLPRSDMPSDDH